MGFRELLTDIKIKSVAFAQFYIAMKLFHLQHLLRKLINSRVNEGKSIEKFCELNGNALYLIIVESLNYRDAIFNAIFSTVT